MKLHETSYDGEAEAEAALRAINSGIRLHEQIEDARQNDGWDTDSGVPYRDSDILVGTTGFKEDLAADLRVLGSILRRFETT